MNTPNWSTQRQITENDIETSEAPALATFNDKIYMVWRGRSTDNLWYSVYNSDSGMWSVNTQIPGNFTSKAPALAVFNKVLYLAYRGKSSDNLYYCTMNKAGNWSSPIKFNDLDSIDARSGSGPALATKNDSLFMAWTGVSGNTLWYNQTNDGTVWTKNTKIDAKPEFGPSLAVYKGTLYIVYHKSNNDICFHSYNNATNQWNAAVKVVLTGRNPQTSGGPAIIADKKFLYLVFRDYRSTRDNIWYMAWDGTNWRYLIDVGIACGAKTSKRVGLVYREAEKNILMVWRGANSNPIWQSFYDPNPEKSTGIYSHRGNVDGPNVNHKENTTAAIQAAIDAGVDGVEFDVQQAKDGLIVCHDPINENETIQQIQKKNPDIPTLEQVLNLQWGNTLADIEIKNEVNDPMDVFNMANAKPDFIYLFCSFEGACLETLASQTEDNQLGYLVNSLDNIEANFKKYNLTPEKCLILSKYTLFDKKEDRQKAKELIDAGYKIGIWTVDSEKDLQSYLLNELVAIIITDIPGFALKQQNLFK